MHGVTVPRVSRDQARAGQGSALDDSLLGNLLNFALGEDAFEPVAIFGVEGRYMDSRDSTLKPASSRSPATCRPTPAT